MTTPKQTLGFRRLVIDEFHGEDGALQYKLRLLNERLELVQTVNAPTIGEAIKESQEWFEWSDNHPPSIKLTRGV